MEEEQEEQEEEKSGLWLAVIPIARRAVIGLTCWPRLAQTGHS